MGAVGFLPGRRTDRFPGRRRRGGDKPGRAADAQPGENCFRPRPRQPPRRTPDRQPVHRQGPTQLVGREPLGGARPEAGRVVFRSWSQSHPERLTEIEGAADLVVEIVSDSSVGKDTKTLPRLYARAGIPELWITDARGRNLKFQIRTLREGAYVAIEPDEEGWLRSPRLGADFRLVRKPSRFTGWDYTLERRGEDG